MAKKKPIMTNAMRMLDKAKIKYKSIEYSADEVGDDFGCKIADLLNLDRETTFKTLVARGDKTGIMVVCIPVANEVDLKKLARVSGNKSAEMIHVKELLGLTGYIRGSVSPIGMKKKYPTYINDTALSHDEMAVSAGICGCSLIMKPEDLIKAIDGIAADVIKEN